MTTADDVLTLDEGAARLRIARKTLRDWVRAGKFPGFKVGREWRVSASDIEHYLQDARARQPHAPNGDREKR